MTSQKIKAAILAGGRGTRMQELTRIVPKPMIEIGGNPILWHIMKIYAHYGVDEFCIALGYRSEIIKTYFTNYNIQRNSIQVDLRRGRITTFGEEPEDWLVSLLDTGTDTQTGGRLARMREYLDDSTFFLTYGDGVGDIDLDALLAFHRRHGRIATVTAVRPPSKFGALDIAQHKNVVAFSEKAHSGDTWVNGGFFVFEPAIFDYVSPDKDCILEREPLENLARDGELMAFHHDGFWQCMDTARDVDYVNGLWECGQAPWKIWS